MPQKAMKQEMKEGEVTPVNPKKVDPQDIRKDPEGKCTVIKGDGSEPGPTAFDKRFAKLRERSEQLQAKTEVTPLGSSQLLVDD